MTYGEMLPYNGDNGRYLIRTDGIYASSSGRQYTAELFVDGESGSPLRYSVYDYIAGADRA